MASGDDELDGSYSDNPVPTSGKRARGGLGRVGVRSLPPDPVPASPLYSNEESDEDSDGNGYVDVDMEDLIRKSKALEEVPAEELREAGIELSRLIRTVEIDAKQLSEQKSADRMQAARRTPGRPLKDATAPHDWKLFEGSPEEKNTWKKPPSFALPIDRVNIQNFLEKSELDLFFSQLSLEFWQKTISNTNINGLHLESERLRRDHNFFYLHPFALRWEDVTFNEFLTFLGMLFLFKARGIRFYRSAWALGPVNDWPFIRQLMARNRFYQILSALSVTLPFVVEGPRLLWSSVRAVIDEFNTNAPIQTNAGPVISLDERSPPCFHENFEGKAKSRHKKHSETIDMKVTVDKEITYVRQVHVNGDVQDQVDNYKSVKGLIEVDRRSLLIIDKSLIPAGAELVCDKFVLLLIRL
jgi:hypothetical protein